MISKATIEKILDAVRIEDVVGDFVNLRKRGVNLLGLCPFHQEKTPSFNVTPAKNIFKCFGCGKGGDAIAFLREHEGFSYPEALRYLASKYKIEIEETEERAEQDPEDALKDQLFVASQFARDFFVRQLWETDEGKGIGLSYFKDRGFREAVIRKFELGYAPASGSTFSIHAVQQGFRPEILQQAGLVTGQNRDFFRDRVMFTIHGLSGKPVAFAGRIMGKVAGPKYINSPETPIYHKSNVLYGMYQARQAIRKQDNCYLVEGYTDVLSLAQEGIENVVASSGTALTPEQIRLIKRFTNNLTILYDGDAAGLKAALRGLELVLEQDMNVRVVMLPDGHDPDSYLAAEGPSQFQEYLARESQDFILFKTRMLLDETKEDPVGRARVIREIVESIARVPDSLKRAEYTKICAGRLDVAEAMLIQEINVALAERMEKARKEAGKASGTAERAQPEEEGSIPSTPWKPSFEHAQELDLVRVLVSGGDRTIKLEDRSVTVAEFILGQLSVEDLSEIQDSGIRHFLLTVKNEFGHIGQLGADHFLKHGDPAIREMAMGFLNQGSEYSENWEKRWQIVLHNQPLPDQNFARDAQLAVNRFLLKRMDQLCAMNAQRIKEAHEAGDAENLAYYMQFQQNLLQLRNETALRELNTIILK